jgi:hypothetical protein
MMISGPKPGFISTGQTRCFDVQGREIECSGSGQDAEFATGLFLPPEERFHVHDRTVLDALTGLSFLRDASALTFPLSWSEAVQAVKDMNAEAYGGFNDWRLPAREELSSLVSFDTADPVLPANHPFENVFSGKYWTTTPWAGNNEFAWYVQFSGGREFFEDKAGYCMVWPVRGNSKNHSDPGANPRFETKNDLVLDAWTGLVWTRNADLCQGACTWQQALDHAASLRVQKYSGRTDWRLPNIREFLSLVDTGFHHPALNRGHPFQRLGEVYWSSTSSSLEPDWAMALYMHKGALGVGIKTEQGFLAWAVAGP